MTNTLDGKYTVTTQGSAIGKASDGFTVVKGGKTQRIDGVGCLWHSRFELIDDQHVKMISEVDPTYADDGFTLIGPDGQPSEEKQIFEAVLTIETDAAQFMLKGTLMSGEKTVKIIMRRVDGA